jgi:hypothetical protein
MSTAPTRRGALRSTAAALFAGVAISPTLSIARPPSQDAELIAACAEAFRCEEWRNRVNAAPATDDPDADDAETDDMNRAWNAAFERLIELRAHTPAGFRAKIAALRIAVLENVVLGAEYTLERNGLRHEQLAVSLCDDVLAGSALA